MCWTGREPSAISGGDMKDFVNPLVLLIVVALLSFRVCGVGEPDALQMWLLVLCATAFIVDSALAVARGMTRRPALMSVVWSVVFLIVGCTGWLMGDADSSASEEDYQAYRSLYEAYRQGGNPYEANAEGDSLLAMAAYLGKKRVVEELLSRGNIPAGQMEVAACRAAEAGRVDVLELLLKGGVQSNSKAADTTLLCAAVQNGQRATVELLLQAGADANLADAEGTPPLVHAVLAESIPVVRLLLKAGADVSRTDAAGRDPLSYSRSPSMDSVLTTPPSE